MTLAITDTQTESDAPGRPTGHANRWTRDEIALLAAILLLDALDVSATWNALAGATWRGLLLAVAVEDIRDVPAPRRPALWFDVQSQRYGRGSEAIPADAVFAVLEAVKQRAAKLRAAEVAAVYAGMSPIGDWQDSLARTIKTLALMARALGRGGVNRLTGDDLKEASADLTFHLTRLDRFARQIEAGVETTSEATQRAAAYAVSVITGGFDTGRRGAHIDAGFTQERNILAPAEHCASTEFTEGCLDVTAQGWVKIGTLPPPGTRTCRFNCKCHFEFRRA